MPKQQAIKKASCRMLFLLPLLCYLELLLAYTTKRTDIVIGEILECNTWFNTLLGITNLGVVNPLAYCTNIFFHNIPVLIFNNRGNILFGLYPFGATASYFQCKYTPFIPNLQ